MIYRTLDAWLYVSPAFIFFILFSKFVLVELMCPSFYINCIILFILFFCISDCLQ